MSVSYSFNNTNPDGGLIVDEDQAEECWEDIFGNKSQTQFYKEISQGLPRGVSLFMDFDEDEKKISSMIFSKGEAEFSFSYLFAPDKAEFFGGSVLKLCQSAGISKKVQANMFKFMAENGIENLEIKALEMGAYAWSRLGFTPTSQQWNGTVRETISERLDIIENKLLKNNKILGGKDFSDMYIASINDNPKAIWSIVDNKKPFPLLPNLTWGKVLTFPTVELPETFGFRQDVTYEGSFNFSDKEACSRASNYLYGQKDVLTRAKEKAVDNIFATSKTVANNSRLSRDNFFRITL